MSLRKAKQLLEHKKLQQQKLNKPLERVSDADQQLEDFAQKRNVFSFGTFSDESEEHLSQQQDNQHLQTKETITEQDQAKKKKRKRKKKKITEDQELQQALKQLDMRTKTQPIDLQQKTSPKVWESILEISQNKFNYEKELKRHFRNWQEDLPEKDPELDRRQQKLQKQLRKMMKKSVLSPGIKDYFSINEKFEVQRSEDGKIRFVPTKKYEQYQVEYEAIKNSNDINALFYFTQTHPEHVDSLYGVGEFLRLQGNYRDSDSLIQRVIYIYEMAGNYDIIQFVKESFVKKQIVYDLWSKSLFMSIFKFMDILGKKGCFRTALEYNKLLLKMNINDPTACLLCLDYNSISASQPEFLIDFVAYYSHYINQKQKSLYLMPNFIYSFALAKFSIQNRSDKSQSEMVIEESNITDLILFTEQDWKDSLKLPSDEGFLKQSSRVLILRAIMVYPKLIFDIAKKNEYGKQILNHTKFQGWQKKPFKNILDHEFWTFVPESYSYHFLRLESLNDSKGLDKILEVYVQRSKILWKSNDVMLWIKAALGFVLNELEKTFEYQKFLQDLCTENCGGIQIPFSLSRYQNISKSNFSDRSERIDLNNIQDNQNLPRAQNVNRMNLQGNSFMQFLSSLLPWVNLPENNNQEQDPNQPQIEDD